MDQNYNNISDYIDSIVQSAQLSDISTSQVLIVLAVATLLGLLIGFVYKHTYKGTSYSQSFVITITVMALISSIVIMTVGSNLARAFGLVGTLSIIRFRTALKDPKDIVFIFLSLITGMAVGTQSFHIALIGIPFVLFLIYILNKFSIGSYKSSAYYIQFTHELKEDFIEELLTKLKPYTYEVKIGSLSENGDDSSTKIVLRASLKDVNNVGNIARIIKKSNVKSPISITSADSYVEY